MTVYLKSQDAEFNFKLTAILSCHAKLSWMLETRVCILNSTCGLVSATKPVLLRLEKDVLTYLL